jgi:hypothetical protein
MYVPYIIFYVFFPGGGGGRKLKPNLEGGARCKSLGTSDLDEKHRLAASNICVNSG